MNYEKKNEKVEEVLNNFPFMPIELQNKVSNDDIDVKCMKCKWSMNIVYKVVDELIEEFNEFSERALCGGSWKRAEMRSIRSNILFYYMNGKLQNELYPLPEWALDNVPSEYDNIADEVDDEVDGNV